MSEELLKKMIIRCNQNIQDVEDMLERREDLLSDEELINLHEEMAYHKGSLHILMTILFNEVGFSLVQELHLKEEPIDVIPDEFFTRTYTLDRKFKYIHLN